MNGWNTGQYVDNGGPQNEFVIPKGFLTARGENTIAPAITPEQPGVGPDSAELVARGSVLGGVPSRQNDSPGYEAVFGTADSRRR
ncbi:beta galactosidase jelly roll domain-containing protein [Streptomyces sp. NPDC058534]|uniref:beta galactosidase jelly roll domain-containing protein n=1 Tax=Streptomyces sp. NPDC058534 TaxID=3346541 RepID=UPI00364EDFC5